ncbi:hypothetical protein OUZ56_000676 [Daphnia magna]|uniref:Uncharacterized protein n=1 Tax=Daphnia magna TaxID=35525 RepID=A0ABR0A0F2_9CRUS|nr:hypothetical protein OUZ56_000676 [Daphnia magna]
MPIGFSLFSIRNRNGFEEDIDGVLGTEEFRILLKRHLLEFDMTKITRHYQKSTAPGVREVPDSPPQEAPLDLFRTGNKQQQTLPSSDTNRRSNPFGFDSAVCAALFSKALLQSDDSSRVHDIHIDNGFLRKDESEQVVTSLQQLRLNLRSSFPDSGFSFLSLTFYDASTNVHGRQTLSLCRTVNPEDKRRIIGDMFVKVIDRTANVLNVTWDNLLLGQAVPSAVPFRVASDRGWLLKRTVVQGGTWLGFASTFFISVSLIYPFCFKGDRFLEVSSGDVRIYWVFEMYLMYCGGRKIIQ